MEILHHTLSGALCVKALLGQRLDQRFQSFTQEGMERIRCRRRAADQHLAGREPAELAGDVLPVFRTRGVHLAGRNVRKAHADAARSEHAAEEVIAALVQHGRLQHGARRHAPDDLALYQPFGLLGVLHLLADGDLIPLCHELGDIALRAVVGHAAHGRALLLSAVAAGERQVQFLRDQLGVLKKHLIEIAQTVHQDIVLVFVFDLKILLHHGRELCHLVPSFYIFRANRQRSDVFSISASINSPICSPSPRTHTSRLPSVRAVNG